MSLWDTEDLTNAQINTTYMPELFYATHTAAHADQRVRAEMLGFQAGIKHESNGEPDPDSRNINYAYAQPTLYFGDTNGVSGQIGPLVRVYFSQSDDNPDIEDYLGYFGLDGVLRFGRGWQVAASGRIGADPGKGAVQIDVSYPLKRFIGGQVDTFAHVQYFNGFGESIRTYNEHDQMLRVGISFVR
jgi:outer membrane phospholipase A